MWTVAVGKVTMGNSSKICSAKGFLYLDFLLACYCSAVKGCDVEDWKLKAAIMVLYTLVHVGELKENRCRTSANRRK